MIIFYILVLVRKVHHYACFKNGSLDLATGVSPFLYNLYNPNYWVESNIILILNLLISSGLGHTQVSSTAPVMQER